VPESPFDQHRYQVRHEWGIQGLERLAPADVVVIVDVLSFSTAVTDAASRGESVRLDSAAHAVSVDGAAIAQAAAESGAVVLLGCLRNAGAVARAVLDIQHRRAERTSIAVLAAGALRHAQGSEGARTDAAVRFAVEDQLGAGAVVDALGDLGIDHTSPEAAAACEAFRGLRGAVRHLLTASGSGQELLDRGARDEVLNAAAVDAASVVPVLRDGAFVAY
jgi:2-phosphosulfolactate phosphatase